MLRKCGMLSALLLVCVVLLGMPKPAPAAMFGHSVFSDVEDSLRDADKAYEKHHEHKKGRDAARYERDWIDREHKLEQTRIDRISKEAKKASHHDVRKMRENGRSWKDISDHYRVDAHKMGYGHKGPHGYDRDHDRDLYRHLYKKH